MCHWTSEQFPSGRPAIVDDPHAPLKGEPPVVDPPLVVADPPLVVEPPPVDDPPVVVWPAAPSEPEGAVGLKSFDVCWIEHPVTSVEASSRPRRERCFMMERIPAPRYLGTCAVFPSR